VDYARQSQEVWNMYKLRKEKERLRKEKKRARRQGRREQLSATAHMIDAR